MKVGSGCEELGVAYSALAAKLGLNAMKVVHCNDCLLHDPPYEILSGKLVGYFESPTRYTRIKQALSSHTREQAGLDSRPGPLFEFVEAYTSLDVEKHIFSVHEEEYVAYLRNAYEEWVKDGGDKAAVLPECFAHGKLPQNHSAAQLPPIAKAGLYCFDLSCPITSDTYTSAIASVRVALTACSILQERADVNPTGVFALTRPPGHHAGTSISGGYCFFNNAAIAARFLQQSEPLSAQPLKITILDVDYHHGNGTQQIFYEDPTVFYVSLHASQDYPYFSGTSDERGAGEGQDFNLNIPLPKSLTGDEEYCTALVEAIDHVKRHDPTYLIISLGVDTFKDDPICDFKLTADGYRRIGKLVASIRKPTLFIMEGGYDLDMIGWNVRAVLESFMAGV